MKSKVLMVIVIVIGILFLYIGLSTKYIDNDAYRRIAGEHTKDDKTVLGWSGSKVEVVRLSPTRILYQGHEKNLFYYTSRVNRILLNLNGLYAVKVTIKTSLDAMLGPETIYINPFTKGIIGSDLRL